LLTAVFSEPLAKAWLQIMPTTNFSALLDEVDAGVLCAICDLFQHFSIVREVRLEWDNLSWEIPGSLTKEQASRLGLNMMSLVRSRMELADLVESPALNPRAMPAPRRELQPEFA
jgi:hypothetical protein